MTRSEVYKVLDGERAYQRKVWGEQGERRAGADVTGELATHPTDDGVPEVSHSVGSWMIFIDQYLAQAKHDLTTKPGHTPALHQLRKVAALCVACFEQHGVPGR